jgi:hypothetical protein
MNSHLLSLLIFVGGGFCLSGIPTQALGQERLAAESTTEAPPDLTEVGLYQLAMDAWQALHTNHFTALQGLFPTPAEVRDFATYLDQHRPGFSTGDHANEVANHYVETLATLPDDLSYFYETSPPDSLVKSVKPELVHLEEVENGLHTARVYVLFGRAFDNTAFADQYLSVYAIRMPAGWKLIRLPEWASMNDE